MRSKERRPPAANQGNLFYHRSPAPLQTGFTRVLLFACFVVLIEKPEGCHLISMSGGSGPFLASDSAQFAQLSTEAPVELGLKDANHALKKNSVEEEELINLEGATKLPDGYQHKKSTPVHKAEDKSLLPLKPKTADKPPEQLGEKELLQMPFGSGIHAILSQSKELVSMLHAGLVGSQALDEAAKLSTKLRADIVKDVDALSHTLEQEQANLSVLRRYEREQDALLKAQLGYLMPINPTPPMEDLENVKLASGCIAVPTTAAFLCAALFVFA
ncbi:hypothetical protein Emag_002105 [Eimeria magna]